MKYQDFTLLIRESASGKYSVEARSPVRGEAWGTLLLDPSSQEIKDRLRRLEGGVTDEYFLKEFGSFLFDALFHGGVRDLFHQSLGQATAADGRGLRIKLDLQPPETAFLPWEFLYDEGEECFLAAGALTPLVRYISLQEPIRQLETPLPVRILVVIPAASGLNTAAEKEILEKAFSGLGSEVQLRTLDGNVTPTVLSDVLMEERYHILHFIGHGVFTGEEAYLFFNNEQGEPEAVSAGRVGQLFLGYPSLKLVLLNVCQGATVSATVPLVGLAPQLVRRGIPAVVAMRYPIPDNAAILFAREFYRMLCAGPERGRLDTAICHARNRMWMEFPGKRHLGTPVLFLRSPEGVIFDIQAKGRHSDTLRAIDHTHRVNLAILEEERRNGEASQENQTEIAAAQEGMKRARRIIRRRNIAILGVTLLVFLTSWIGLLNILRVDESIEQMLVHLGNRLSPPPWDATLVVVAVDPESKAGLNLARATDLRAYHARILPKLARARPRVIALDYDYGESSQHDGTMAQAIREARNRGSEVIVGVRKFRIADSQAIPVLAPALREAVSDWGVAEGVLGSVAGYVRKMRLVELQGTNDPRVPFFALQVLYYGLQAKHLELNREENLLTLFNQRQMEIPILQMTDRETGRPLLLPSVRPRRAEIYIRFSLPETLRQHTFSYGRLLSEPEDSPWWQEFREKVVLMGNALAGEDQLGIHPGDKRFGIHILADGINTILQEQYVRPVRTSFHVGILLAMAMTGAFLRLQISPVRKATGRWILYALGLLYLVAAVFVHTRFLILPDIAYHLAGLFLTYWAVGLVRKRLA